MCLWWDKRPGERRRSQASLRTRITEKQGWSPRSRRTCSLAQGPLVFTQTNLCLERFNTSFTPVVVVPQPAETTGDFFLTPNLNLRLLFPLPRTAGPLHSSHPCFSRLRALSLPASCSRLPISPLLYEIPEIATYL